MKSRTWRVLTWTDPIDGEAMYTLVEEILNSEGKVVNDMRTVMGKEEFQWLKEAINKA